MKLTRRLGFLMLAGILASCTACGSETTPVPVEESIQEETDNSVSSSEETPVSESEENSDTQELKLDHTYVTQFGTVNAVSYPRFLFDYPGNWTVTNEEVSQTDETVVLTNERGSTITYTYIGGVAEGQLGSGSATDMTRIELSTVADSQFIPGYVDARNYEDLGKFVVAETKITGTMDMLTDSDFVDTDGAVSFAVLPEKRTGTEETTDLPLRVQNTFWYSGYVSFTAQAPDGQFTEAEQTEVIAILSSFRVEDN